MIHSVASCYATSAATSTQQARKQEPSAQPRQPSGDTVSLSDSSQLMARFFAGMGIDFTPGKAITLDDMKAGLDKIRTSFENRANRLFLQNGIGTNPPAELTSDSEGNVCVKGDHPQKAKIEQLFADHPDLANDFRGVSGLSSFIKAGEEHVEFAAEYARNPYAAVAQYSHLFDSLKDAPFSMVLGGAKAGEQA